MKKVKWYGLIGVSIAVCVVISKLITLFDGNLHIVFCDVGQGDAIFIRTPSREQIIIDGGPNTQVLDCLNGHIPFWDRDITMIMNTHPHYDHFRGLLDVLQRYRVLSVGRENLSHDSAAYEQFMELIKYERSKEYLFERGDRIDFANGVQMTILGPDDQIIAEESENGMIGSKNPPSLIINLSYGQFSILFPGDSDGQDLERFVPSQSKYTVLALPHHGSENGYTEDVAQHIQAKIAIASSGKGNRYGHPHEAVLTLLKRNNIPIFRTDTSGDIHIVVSPEGKVTVRTQR
jgi:competence protein ComEC